MTEQDPEYMANVTIRLSGSEDADAICSMLRGLLYSNRNSNGQRKSTPQFIRGTTITFGAAPMARKFVQDLRRLFSKKVRDRLAVTLHG